MEIYAVSNILERRWEIHSTKNIHGSTTTFFLENLNDLYTIKDRIITDSLKLKAVVDIGYKNPSVRRAFPTVVGEDGILTLWSEVYNPTIRESMSAIDMELREWCLKNDHINNLLTMVLL